MKRFLSWSLNIVFKWHIDFVFRTELFRMINSFSNTFEVVRESYKKKRSQVCNGSIENKSSFQVSKSWTPHALFLVHIKYRLLTTHYASHSSHQENPTLTASRWSRPCRRWRKRMAPKQGKVVMIKLQTSVPLAVRPTAMTSCTFGFSATIVQGGSTASVSRWLRPWRKQWRSTCALAAATGAKQRRLLGLMWLRV